MCFGGVSVPNNPPAPPPRNVDQTVVDAKDRQRRAQANAYGNTATFSNGAPGLLTPATIQTKTLLGR